jgi:nucleotidyltransferase/DNA polymerase involved in DNA repair
MDSQFISLSSWPQAIMHIDADAFFASCEQAIHPELRSRPEARPLEVTSRCLTNKVTFEEAMSKNGKRPLMGTIIRMLYK